MEQVRPSRELSSGSLIGRDSRRVSGLHGTFRATARPLCAVLTESILKNTAPFTALALHNSSHLGVQAQLCFLPPAVWTIRGQAFPVETRIRYCSLRRCRLS